MGIATMNRGIFSQVCQKNPGAGFSIVGLWKDLKCQPCGMDGYTGIKKMCPHRKHP